MASVPSFGEPQLNTCNVPILIIETFCRVVWLSGAYVIVRIVEAGWRVFQYIQSPIANCVCIQTRHLNWRSAIPTDVVEMELEPG